MHPQNQQKCGSNFSHKLLSASYYAFATCVATQQDFKPFFSLQISKENFHCTPSSLHTHSIIEHNGSSWLPICNPCMTRSSLSLLFYISLQRREEDSHLSTMCICLFQIKPCYPASSSRLHSYTLGE